LEKALKTAPVVYSVHKTTSKKFVAALAKDFGFEVTHYYEYDFPLKATMEFHKKKVQFIRAGCWRIARKHL
jgi:predicted RNA methylase